MSEARARIGRWDQYQRRTVKVPSRRRSSSASERTTCTTDEKAALANDEVLVELIVAMSAECRERLLSKPHTCGSEMTLCVRGREEEQQPSKVANQKQKIRSSRSILSRSSLSLLLVVCSLLLSSSSSWLHGSKEEVVLVERCWKWWCA